MAWHAVNQVIKSFNHDTIPLYSESSSQFNQVARSDIPLVHHMLQFFPQKLNGI